MNMRFVAYIIGICCGGIIGLLIPLTRNGDPVYKCDYYKKHGCSIVDGPYCDMETCKTKLEHDLFWAEQALGIPLHLRYHNRNK